MITNCPVCGKAFDVLWPQLWAYRDGSLYFCTWKCLRQMRKEAEEMKTLTEDEKRAAAEVALTGGNPLPYLKSLGVTNVTTSWNTVRNWARGHLNQDEYEKLPEKLGNEKTKAEKPKVELVYDPSIAEEYKREQAQKEANRKAREEALEEGNKKKIFSEVEFRPLEISAVKSRVIEVGTYRNMGKMTLDIGGADYLSMTAEGWRELSAEILVALAQLGLTGD